MNSWIIIAIIGYLFLAVKGVVDKFLLTKTIKAPLVYVFYTGIVMPLVLILAPFGLKSLSFFYVVMGLAAGMLFAAALFFFFSAIKQTSISRILPIEGGLVPLFTLGLAYIFLGESL